MFDHPIYTVLGFSLIALFIGGILLLLGLGKIEIDFWHGILKISSKS
jgi:hypothetical protein